MTDNINTEHIFFIGDDNQDEDHIEIRNDCIEDKDVEIFFNENNLSLLTSDTSNRKKNLVNKVNRKHCDSYLIRRIFNLFNRFVILFLNDNFKINKNIKFRFIKPITNSNSIILLMKKNIKYFCDLNISEKNKRKNNNINKKWLKQIKNKLGGDFLKIKLSTLYKKFFLSESSEISIKSLIKTIDNNTDYMLINKNNIYNLLKNKKKKNKMYQYQEKLIEFAKKLYLKINK